MPLGMGFLGWPRLSLPALVSRKATPLPSSQNPLREDRGFALYYSLTLGLAAEPQKVERPLSYLSSEMRYLPSLRVGGLVIPRPHQCFLSRI